MELGRFAMVGHAIWQTVLQNLEEFATESCGPKSKLTHGGYTCSPWATFCLQGRPVRNTNNL